MAGPSPIGGNASPPPSSNQAPSPFLEGQSPQNANEPLTASVSAYLVGGGVLIASNYGLRRLCPDMPSEARLFANIGVISGATATTFAWRWLAARWLLGEAVPFNAAGLSSALTGMSASLPNALIISMLPSYLIDQAGSLLAPNDLKAPLRAGQPMHEIATILTTLGLYYTISATPRLAPLLTGVGGGATGVAGRAIGTVGRLFLANAAARATEWARIKIRGDRSTDRLDDVTNQAYRTELAGKIVGKKAAPYVHAFGGMFVAFGDTVAGLVSRRHAGASRARWQEIRGSIIEDGGRFAQWVGIAVAESLLSAISPEQPLDWDAATAGVRARYAGQASAIQGQYRQLGRIHDHPFLRSADRVMRRISETGEVNREGDWQEDLLDMATRAVRRTIAEAEEARKPLQGEIGSLEEEMRRRMEEMGTLPAEESSVPDPRMAPQESWTAEQRERMENEVVPIALWQRELLQSLSSADEQLAVLRTHIDRLGQLMARQRP